MAFRNALLSVLSILIFSILSQNVEAQKQHDTYKDLWQKVESLEAKGLSRSALQQVDIIYHKAKMEKNETQVIKSLLYKNKLVLQFEEDGLKKMIDTLQREIGKTSGTEKAILQSITAQLYENYFRANRYRLYSATNTENFKKEDIATWTVTDFQNKISKLYEESLSVPASRKISLEPFDAIIEKGNVRDLRPTLFDLLAHRALDYFKSTENEVIKPAYAFEINDTIVYAAAREFAKANFQTEDTASLKLKALKLFQDLIQMHLNDVKPLVDVDLERLEFVHANATMPSKDVLYMHALKNIYTSYKDPIAAEAGFRAGQLMFSNASTGSDPDRMVEAVQWLERVAQQFPGDNGSRQAKNLLNAIKAPLVKLQSEKVNVPAMPFRTLVTFKNINKIYLRILKVTKKQKEEINALYPMEKRFLMMQKLTQVREWNQELPDIKDYLEHSAEINTGSLPVGEYIIWASVNKNFEMEKNAMAAQYVYVSNISFVQNGSHFFALNRTTGAPLINATVVPWRQRYDYKERKYIIRAQRSLLTDKHGYFSVKAEDKLPGSLLLEITSGDDHLFLDDAQNLYTYNSFQEDDREDYDSQAEYDEDYAKFFLFTDRSIYRPGQEVFFKGIGVTKSLQTGKSVLLQYKDSITVYLNNANNEATDSAKVKLNEYGSFNGKFTIPQNQLTGQFDISVEDFDGGNVSFSVEEYKRPKFFVEFEKAKESYRLNDTVRIVGNANAYAGNKIDGATVKYRITRIPRFLYPWFFWRRGLPQTSTMEISNGETVTNADGKFYISFAAIPDRSIDPETDPVFDYKIHADVTDINGETRSEEIIVPVAYKALNLQIGFRNKAIFQYDSLKSIALSASNLSNEPQNIKAVIKIFQLQTPGRLMRERLWQEPDTTVMSATQFIALFPHDVYRNENKPETWEKKEMVFEQQDSVHGFKSIALDKKLHASWYVAEATSLDPYGKEVKDVKYFRIIHPASGEMAGQDYFLVEVPNRNFQPCDTAKLMVGTSADIHLIQQIEKAPRDTSEQKPSFSYFNIEGGFKDFQHKIDEDDRGGFAETQFLVKDNRFYSNKTLMNVPWSNKQLDISFDTYRDKTTPGSKESWKVSVKGMEGQKVAAEMLASMYDASLNQFVPHYWRPMNLWPQYTSYNSWNADQNFSILTSFQYFYPTTNLPITAKQYDRLKYLPENHTYFLRSPGLYGEREGALDEVVVVGLAPGKETKKEMLVGKVSGVMAQTDSTVVMGPAPEKTSPTQPEISPIRTNFNETVFFYPELRTDKDGNISFSFNMPDALTKWRMMLQAHTKDLATGYAEKSVITQKDLMVMPNAPRFFREGDKIFFSAKVVNMTDQEVSGLTEFHLLNASTMNPVDKWFENDNTQKPFTIAARKSALVTFSIHIPKGFNDVVIYRIVATTDHMSDGEEAYIPVVTNRMLVTETMPVPMSGTGAKDFTFEKLLKSGSSNTLTNYALTVEYTTNLAWYAVQALPYLNLYPYECTEQVFNRYFANALALHISNTAPRVKAIFEKWKIQDTAALMSNLEKNQELKSVLLEETPWVMQAKTESEQKQNIAMLFDLVKMSRQLESALTIVKDRQTPNGGFTWFKNGPDDRFITQYIVADIGHLKKLNGWPKSDAVVLQSLAGKALKYLDARIVEDYEKLKKSKVDMDQNQLSTMVSHYLYTRSFFPEHNVTANARIAYNYYFGQAKKYWLQQSTYDQGMIALTMFRNGELQTAQAIVSSLKEKSILSEELGRYWKEWNTRGYWWYQAPIESQSLMIEVFSEVTRDGKAVGQLKTWLLKNKQTNNWQTTKATAEAVYALLLQGGELTTTGSLSETKNVRIKLGKTVIESNNEVQEVGTGYFKRSIAGHNVEPTMGKVHVTVSSPDGKASESPSWGAVYWQYFEDLDKITFAETPLKISKKLFVEKNTDRGPVLTPVNDGDNINIGDKIKVRIELRVDRDMEYVHMKDMRASCMEPVNVLSGYKWQGGLGYYESTKDVSTNFFFNYLPKGTYVFEYPMFVTHAGNFSNGVTTIQCMYAPEFTAHSEGVRVEVSEK